jgi:FAD/FMN-containing dehydrogenase
VAQNGGVERLLEELAAVVGPANVLTEHDDRYLLDWRGVHRGSCLAVARPGSTTEAATVVARCAAAGVSIVPQGGNSGLSGGAIPGARRSVVVSLERMTHIQTVDADGATVTAEAGCTIEALQDAAADAGLMFAPDWGARGTATLGGAIATDAGGINVLRYGNMRAHVLGIEVVLADGQIWDGLRALHKDSSGYDLKHLFIGSEGTLGLVTRAVVALQPATPFHQSALLGLRSLPALPDVVATSRRMAPRAITALELVPDRGLERVCRVLGIQRPMATRRPWYALVKLADTTPVDERLGELLAALADRDLIDDAVAAGGPEQEERLWTIRDELPIYRLYRHQAMAIKNDAAVPVGAIPDLVDRVERLVRSDAPAGTFSYTFGHAGDGNLHIAVLPDDDADPAPFIDVRDALRDAIDATVLALGGTLSAEHGIGQELLARIGPQKPAVEWAMMRSVKHALDPHDLMNPGKLFPDA